MGGPLVVTKPAGWLCDGSRAPWHGGAAADVANDLLSWVLGEGLMTAEEAPVFLTCLDANTSGYVMLCGSAKEKELRRTIIHEHNYYKRYLCLVRGAMPSSAELPFGCEMAPDGSRGKITTAFSGGELRTIEHAKGRKRVFAAAEPVEPADDKQSFTTSFRLKEKGLTLYDRRAKRHVEFTLLDVSVDGGAPHQIRVHMRHLFRGCRGCVVGDDRYDYDRVTGDGFAPYYFVNRAVDGPLDGVRRTRPFFLHNYFLALWRRESGPRSGWAHSLFDDIGRFPCLLSRRLGGLRPQRHPVSLPRRPRLDGEDDQKIAVVTGLMEKNLGGDAFTFHDLHMVLLYVGCQRARAFLRALRLARKRDRRHPEYLIPYLCLRYRSAELDGRVNLIAANLASFVAEEVRKLGLTSDVGTEEKAVGTASSSSGVGERGRERAGDDSGRGDTSRTSVALPVVVRRRSPATCARPREEEEPREEVDPREDERLMEKVEEEEPMDEVDEEEPREEVEEEEPMDKAEEEEKPREEVEEEEPMEKVEEEEERGGHSTAEQDAREAMEEERVDEPKEEPKEEERAEDEPVVEDGRADELGVVEKKALRRIEVRGRFANGVAPLTRVAAGGVAAAVSRGVARSRGPWAAARGASSETPKSEDDNEVGEGRGGGRPSSKRFRASWTSSGSTSGIEEAVVDGDRLRTCPLHVPPSDHPFLNLKVSRPDKDPHYAKKLHGVNVNVTVGVFSRMGIDAQNAGGHARAVFLHLLLLVEAKARGDGVAMAPDEIKDEVEREKRRCVDDVRRRHSAQ